MIQKEVLVLEKVSNNTAVGVNQQTEVDRRTGNEDRTVPHLSTEAHSEKLEGSDL
jgi:hypothetical protein